MVFAASREMALLLTFLCLAVAHPARAQAVSTADRLNALEQRQAEAEAELQRTRSELEALRASGGTDRSAGNAAPRTAQATAAVTPDFLDVNKFISPGDFPGSIKGPAGISFQIGGYVAADVIADFNRITSGDSFVTSAIPTGPSGGAPVHWTFSARQSRFFIKTSTPIKDAGTFITYLEGDFFSPDGGYGFRLRHAYGQFEHFVAGQTYSTFVDAAMFPMLLDFQGPSGLMLVRQVLVRYMTRITPDWQLAISAEEPRAEITAAPGESGSTRSSTPDFAVQFRYGSQWGHVQLAAVARWLGWAPSVGPTVSDLGLGLNLTTQVNVATKDTLLFQLAAGKGIARYGNDTGGKGLDAVSDGRGHIQVLGTLGTMLAYTHFWFEKLSSTVTYSYSWVEDSPLLPATANHQANYVAANLLLYPIPRATVGVEYLWGNFQTRDRAHGYANRIQTSFNFKF